MRNPSNYKLFHLRLVRHQFALPDPFVRSIIVQ